MGKRVVVTGSNKGSRTAFAFIKLILSFYGVKPIFVTPKEKIPSRLDALLISGGVDICPDTYGGKESVARCEKERDNLELELMQRAFEVGAPIFGICRGMQLINVFFGGVLHPDIKDLDLNRPHPKSPFPVNDIEIVPKTRLHSIMQTSKIKANALHHQAVKSLGDGLRVNAKDANGLIQGIEYENRFIMGVQWHPEFMPYSLPQRRLFKSFVNEIVI